MHAVARDTGLGEVVDAAAGRLVDEVDVPGGLVVAFSGGVDSSVVLAAALQALRPGAVLAGIADSPSLPRAELAAARRLCDELGAELAVVGTDELADPGYQANAGDRCYFCKRTVLSAMGELARGRGLAAVATGTHLDDRRAPHRPGLRAAAELAVLEPLASAGFGKDLVRALAARWGLPVADKPSMPCLASRIAVGITVSGGRLRVVERAELTARSLLTERGVPVRDLRVRLLGERFRVELDDDAYDIVAGRPALAAELVAGVGRGGVDGRGEVARYRSGSISV